MAFHVDFLTKYLRILTAGFMSVWLTGVVFLFCCDEMNGMARDAGPMSPTASHCDMSKGAAASHLADSGPVTVHDVRTDQVDCCGFLPAVFDKVRKIEKDRDHVAPSLTVAEAKFHPLIVRRASVPPAAIYGRAAFPEKIFIKNCVFRI